MKKLLIALGLSSALMLAPAVAFADDQPAPAAGTAATPAPAADTMAKPMKAKHKAHKAKAHKKAHKKMKAHKMKKPMEKPAAPADAAPKT